MLRSWMLALTIVLSATGFAEAETLRTLPQSAAQVQLSYAPLVKRAAPAVVNIFTRKTVQTRGRSLFDDPFFRRFFGDQFGLPEGGGQKRKVQNSLGSGVIVSSQGIVVTNNHVIDGADEIIIVLSDRREFEAKVIGTDEHTDLAILEIEAAEDLPVLPFADSDSLEVGDLVLAIGNPFGVGQTVTSGIVSATSRTQEGLSDINAFIQTDAAINPGNSGGALINMAGDLIGINTAIFSKSGGSHGIGFAIPSNLVRAVMASIKMSGRLVRAWLGAEGQSVTKDLALSLGMDRPGGILINRVFPGSPADRAGLKVGDVLVAIEGFEIATPGALRYRIATLGIGRSAAFHILRKGRPMALTVELIAPPESPPRDIREITGNSPVAGAVVANMSPALASELGVEGFEPGVIVLRLRRGSNAQRIGLRVGDRLIAVNGKAIDLVQRLEGVLANLKGRMTLTIERNGKRITASFE